MNTEVQEYEAGYKAGYNNEPLNNDSSESFKIGHQAGKTAAKKKTLFEVELYTGKYYGGSISKVEGLTAQEAINIWRKNLAGMGFFSTDNQADRERTLKCHRVSILNDDGTKTDVPLPLEEEERIIALEDNTVRYWVQAAGKFYGVNGSLVGYRWFDEAIEYYKSHFALVSCDICRTRFNTVSGLIESTTLMSFSANDGKADMHDACNGGRDYDDMRIKFRDGKISYDEWVAWYNERCAKCVHMSEICHYGDEDPKMEEN